MASYHVRRCVCPNSPSRFITTDRVIRPFPFTKRTVNQSLGHSLMLDHFTGFDGVPCGEHLRVKKYIDGINFAALRGRARLCRVAGEGAETLRQACSIDPLRFAVGRCNLVFEVRFSDGGICVARVFTNHFLQSYTPPISRHLSRPTRRLSDSIGVIVVLSHWVSPLWQSSGPHKHCPVSGKAVHIQVFLGVYSPWTKSTSTHRRDVPIDKWRTRAGMHYSLPGSNDRHSDGIYGWAIPSFLSRSALQ